MYIRDELKIVYKILKEEFERDYPEYRGVIMECEFDLANPRIKKTNYLGDLAQILGRGGDRIMATKKEAFIVCESDSIKEFMNETSGGGVYLVFGEKL